MSEVKWIITVALVSGFVLAMALEFGGRAMNGPHVVARRLLRGRTLSAIFSDKFFKPFISSREETAALRRDSCVNAPPPCDTKSRSFLPGCALVSTRG
jgi:hypothetical protein